MAIAWETYILGTQRTEWTALSSSRSLIAGDQLKIAAGNLQVTLD